LWHAEKLGEWAKKVKEASPHVTIPSFMVSMQDIRAAAAEIARQFSPKRIVLFGSHAYGNATPDSDVDLLILWEGKHVHARALKIRKAIDFRFPVDLLVRSPEEFVGRIAQGDGFLKEIQDKGKILYEAPDARMGAKSRRRLSNRTPGSTRPKNAELR
jgi:predicted nucleotidyltransferase